MKFLEIVEKLQEENEGYIVLVRCGIFFNAIGKDAVILQEVCGLTPICMKLNLCKCGIPVATITKFIRKINQEKNLAIVVYDYNKDKREKYTEILRIEGNKTNETRKCLECEKCWYSNNRIIKNINNMEKMIEELGNIKNEQ